MACLEDLSEQPIVILDGGLGTTLEDIFGTNISHTPLWSAKPIVESPDTIIQAHLAFLRAGAKIITTSTYQCSFATFERAGFSQAEAKAIMLKSVDLARKAQVLFHNETQQPENSNDKAQIAISLGPFGASLLLSQEFDGYYPPPYGPKAFSDKGDNYNAFGLDEGKEDEIKSIDALARFHYERVLVFLDDVQTWKAISYLAFETVPLAREVKAIRKAMGWLQTEIDSRGKAAGDVEIDTKPWWISCVFPDGQFPETHGRGGTRLTVRDVVAAALDSAIQDESSGNVIAGPHPTGLGINCTPIDFLPGLVKEMTEAVNEIWDKCAPKPWLIIYPNRGAIYDPASRTWGAKEMGEIKMKDRWADELGEIVKNIKDRSTWGRVVVGGCCKTGPAEIHQLSGKLNL